MTSSSPPRPIRPTGDLRTMVVENLQGRGLALLAAAEERRRAAFRDGRWEEYAQAVRAHVAEAFGDMPFGPRGAPLQARPVSTHDLGCCHVENVLFDSFPGWQVNASVFVPRGVGPFPAVVIPVGHSGKQYDNYQVPARAFASLGFLAVLFDPPGQDSEKKPGNDHFRDGVRTFLTGHSSSRYFVLDALRCIDYLETRGDADLSNGVGMTGVSGGGHTTLFSVLFDDRITCQGPSCCIERMADHPVGDLYSACPESMWSGRLAAGVDELDVLLAGIPTPALYMAGQRDEVFHIDWSRALAAEAGECFAAAGVGERFRFFEDDSGHAYTLAQVRQFAAWMNRWVVGEPERPVPGLEAADFPLVPYEKLQCHPAPEENIYTLNRAIARQQAEARRAGRSAGQLRQAVERVVGAPGPVNGWQESAPFQVWSQTSREALIAVEGLEVPATWLEPVSQYARPHAPVVLCIDAAGRRAALESSGPATLLCGMLQRDPELVYPSILVPDLPGWGDSEPALMPYAMAGWGSMDRFTAYLSCALGDGILAMRTRCAAALVEHLVAERGVAAARIVLVGRGLGGAVALMAAALVEGPLRGAAAWNGPASFQMLTEAEDYTWPAAAFLPDALVDFDLPDLVRGLETPVLVLDPLDAAGQAMEGPAAEALYGPLAGAATVVAGCADSDAVAQVQRLLSEPPRR